MRKTKWPVVAVLVAAMMMSMITGAFAVDTAAIEQCKNRQTIAHEMAECARALGLGEDCETVKTAQGIWWAEQDKILALQSEPEPEPEAVEEDTYVAFVSDKYPVAAQVWNFLRNDMGLSEPVAAGIIGNFMAECGGQTLGLQYWIGSGNYYGLAMWYAPYTNGEIYWGVSLEDQLAYLQKTMKKNIEYFGGDWDYFVSIDNPYDAAWAFTVYYERGAWAYIRGTNAMDAYNYFTGG